MRIGDWSSDVCSSDLVTNTIKPAPSLGRPGFAFFTAATVRLPILLSHTVSHIMRCLAVDVNGQCCTNKIEECKYFRRLAGQPWKIGRASCRERVCQYV